MDLLKQAITSTNVDLESLMSTQKIFCENIKYKIGKWQPNIHFVGLGAHLPGDELLTSLTQMAKCKNII